MSSSSLGDNPAPARSEWERAEGTARVLGGHPDLDAQVVGAAAIFLAELNERIGALSGDLRRRLDATEDLFAHT